MAKTIPINPTNGVITMMTLDTKPTRQQLDDRLFWDNISPNGAEYDGLKYTPTYSVLINGEPVKYKTDNGKPVSNSFFYDLAIKEVERLSNDRKNVDLEITGYWQQL